MKFQLILVGLCAITLSAQAQFHTLKMPQASVDVTETQQLGVTEITIDYSSPRVNGRDVWNNPNIIPQNADPIAWRAGANMNTTISFSTDVNINGSALPAGKYGFHIVPENEKYTLVFAHANDLWGSYYLDMDRDVALKVVVQSEACAFSEKLDYEFIYQSDSSVVIGLEWAEQRIPFTVSVDLNGTVLTSLRSELRGINTYRWQAWNDAANWCLNRNVNLEEALEWADRSIDGGFGGFGGDRNINNMLTKGRLELALDKPEAANTIDEMMALEYSAYEANSVFRWLIGQKLNEQSLEFITQANKKHPDTWYLKLNYGVALYLNGKQKSGISQLDKVMSEIPDPYKERVTEIRTEMENGTYQVGA